mmetsp:Transcript_44150/g.71773  ORF Transcript_44150/g.71773 Transcript_44150/m.71773 type:complete len:200 (-) Transcript_44150:554-1153(-)
MRGGRDACGAQGRPPTSPSPHKARKIFDATLPPPTSHMRAGPKSGKTTVTRGYCAGTRPWATPRLRQHRLQNHNKASGLRERRYEQEPTNTSSCNLGHKCGQKNDGQRGGCARQGCAGASHQRSCIQCCTFAKGIVVMVAIKTAAMLTGFRRPDHHPKRPLNTSTLNRDPVVHVVLHPKPQPPHAKMQGGLGGSEHERA